MPHLLSYISLVWNLDERFPYYCAVASQNSERPGKDDSLVVFLPGAKLESLESSTECEVSIVAQVYSSYLNSSPLLYLRSNPVRCFDYFYPSDWLHVD